MLISGGPTDSLFSLSSKESLGDSDSERSGDTDEVLMAGMTTGGSTDFGTENSHACDGGDCGHGDGSLHVPQLLTEQQWEELRRRGEHALRTPITGNTPQEIALEKACLSNLVERECCERIQQSLDAHAARDQRSSTRNRRQLFPNDRPRHIEVMQTPLLNLAAATWIADYIQPSDSMTVEGIR
ncbi:hypothetical protein D1007_51851 [Hordeum vulgare]|nr:hypothetical protein D1007_51851 [Hordeum vulgare]